MQKQIYYKLISIPIILIVTVISFITLFNIDRWNKHEDATIIELTDEFTKRNKEKIHNEVKQFVSEIEYMKEDYAQQLRVDLKNRIEKLNASLESHYNYTQGKISQKEIEKELLNIVRSQNVDGDDHYFFVRDMDTSKALVHNIPQLEGTTMFGRKDQNGLLLFESKVEILKEKEASFQTIYFKKPLQNNKEFEKLIYFKKFKYFNWIIGTGVYMEEENRKIKQKIIDKYNTTQTDLKNYLFAIELHNIKGGKDFATVQVMPNKRELIETQISVNDDDSKLQNYRRNYLKLLREKGEGYIDYWYAKPDTNIESRKKSYLYLYKPWNWLVGSGFYFDDLEKQISKKEQLISVEVKDKTYQMIAIGLFFILLSSILFYTFAKNIVSLIDRYIDRIDKQKNTFEALFENTSDGIILIKNGYFYNCNNTILKMFGFERKERNIIGKTPCELSPTLQKDGCSSKEKAAFYFQKCSNGEDVNFEWIHQRKNGENFDVEITFTKIILENEEIIHAVLRDVSQKNALLKEAKQKDNILIQQAKMASMGEMIGNIAHQWRQPLNALGLIIQKLKMFHESDMLTTEQLNKSVDKSKMLINKMSTTIDDFRNFFKVDKVKQVFSINDAIKNTSLLLESSLVHHNINIKIDAQEQIELLGYKNELEQVFLNLINNSKDALIENKIKDPLIHIKLINTEKMIIIEICDNAKGIPENIIDKIFEPYFTTKEQGKGTGIGLYMSKMILENNMNGELKVRNSTEGACFTVKLQRDNR